MKIDAHQHFWQYDPVKHSWIDNSMSVLKQNFLPYQLSKVLEKNGIDFCVAVQADQSETETDFLIKLGEENGIIKGVVGWVDLRSENILERLEHFANYQPLLKGFRHVVQDEPDPNFMLGAAFQNGIKALSNFDFTYDILIFHHQLDAAIQLVENFPNQKFVIDHIAKPDVKSGEFKTWSEKMMVLGQKPNVYCKVSGMVTEADWSNWKYEDFVPYLDVIFGVFDYKRIMYGSDWPVCLLAGQYSEIKGMVERYLIAHPEEEKAWFWGGAAMDFYSINPHI